VSHDIFLSYSSGDKAVADAVVSALENQNVRCWYAPRDIESGADWGESITVAIHECKVFILIFSSKSNQSKRVLDEIYYAISEEKTILPFRIENLDPTGAMRLHLSRRHWLDAFQPSWQSHISRLVNSVSINLGREIVPGDVSVSPAAPEAARKIKPLVWVLPTIFLIVLISFIGFWWFSNRDIEVEVDLTSEVAVSTTEILPTLSGDTPSITQTTSAETTGKAETTTAPAGGTSEAVILDGFFIHDDIYLSQQIYTNEISLILNKNLYVNLTDYDLTTAQVIPNAAKSWTVSPDGRTYTFKLRNDIPWVVHPLGGTTTQAMDEDGQPRFLTAHDFVYGIRQICDPRLYSGGFDIYYIEVIKGCNQVFNYDDINNILPELFESIGIRAISDDELMIELEWPSGYFLTMSSMPIFAAAPQWAVEKFGAAWTNPGDIVTNGHFVIDEWVTGESIRLVHNPLLPAEMVGSGNIDTINLTILTEIEEAYELWLNNELDYSLIPPGELLSHRVSYARETSQVFEQAVSFIMFQLNRPPFDNVHARRAFSAAFDRTSFINVLENGEGLPMKHFAAPGIFGAPSIDEIGVGYDLNLARSELAEAGYPDCQGFPSVTFSVDYNHPYYLSIESTLKEWEKNLNCPEGTISLLPSNNINSQDNPDAELVFGSWTGDYPDEHNWVGRLTCGSSMLMSDRTCNEIDDWIREAAEVSNNTRRIELYAQIEEAFFGVEGEYPIIPVHMYFEFVADHTWLNRTQSTWGETFYTWTIDMEAKLAGKE
jgi:oligopeptide transport system substrate-binding protein